MLGNIIPFWLLSSKLLNMLGGALSTLKLGKAFMYAINFQWYVALSTNVRKGATSKMALSSPLSSFHLTFFFPVFYHYTIASNSRKVCSLKNILYLANLASSIATFEAWCFHYNNWFCNSGIIIPMGRFVWACKLVTISYDSYNYHHMTSSLSSYSTPCIPCWCRRVKTSSLNSFKLFNNLSLYLFHLQMFLQGGYIVGLQTTWWMDELYLVAT